MGQAKNRGSFEERRAAAIERETAVAEKRRQDELWRRMNMTPEEKERERQARLSLGVIAAFLDSVPDEGAAGARSLRRLLRS